MFIFKCVEAQPSKDPKLIVKTKVSSSSKFPGSDPGSDFHLLSAECLLESEWRQWVGKLSKLLKIGEY